MRGIQKTSATGECLKKNLTFKVKWENFIVIEFLFFFSVTIGLKRTSLTNGSGLDEKTNIKSACRFQKRRKSVVYFLGGF